MRQFRMRHSHVALAAHAMLGLTCTAQTLPPEVPLRAERERAPLVEVSPAAARTGSLLVNPWNDAQAGAQPGPGVWAQAWTLPPIPPKMPEIVAEDARMDGQSGHPYRVGVKLQVPGGEGGVLTPTNAGVWSDLPDGSRIWRLAISSPGAQALALTFQRFQLPPGGRLLISGSDPEFPANVFIGQGRGTNGSLSPKPTPGDSIYVEYHHPANAQAARIEIDGLVHNYRSFPKASARFGDRGVINPCHVDVRCRTVPPDVRDAVGLLYFVDGGFSYVCSGTLLSDLDTNTWAAWFLTAQHCINSHAVADTAVVFWFYQTPTCNAAPPSIFSVPTTSGASLLSFSPQAGGFDHSFLRLDDDLLYGQGTAGYNANPLSDNNASVFNVSHPAGTFRRYASGVTTFVGPDCSATIFSAYSRVDWLPSEGFTEGGSSGSALFDSDWNVRGQLQGTCSFGPTDCASASVMNHQFGRLNGSYPGFASYLTTAQPEDSFEPNDSLAASRALTQTGETLYLSDFNDYYIVHSSGGPSTFSIVGWARGVYDAAWIGLYDRFGAGITFSYLANGPGLDQTSASITANLAPGEYRLRVSRFYGQGGAYTLQLPVTLDCRDWRPAATIASPTGRDLAPLVYDSVRQETVLAGGSTDAGQNAETWAWNGAKWTLMSSLGLPPRIGSAMAYDASRQRMVLFGGLVDGNYSDQTVHRVGTSWQVQSLPPTSPSPRWLHAMTYDSARQKIILFGGQAASGRSNELWEYDGTWTLRSSAGPSARSHASLTYDPVRQRTVLFGGSTNSGVSNETWEWNGVSGTWEQRMIAAPSPRDHAGTVFDVARGVLVLYGGFNGDALSDTWEYDGTAWTARQIAGPRKRTNHQLAYDALRQRVVVFGGNPGPGTHIGDTWEYNGTYWTPVASPESPDARSGAAFAAFTSRAYSVIHGGTGNSFGVSDETFVRSATAWGLLAPVSGGPTRFLHASAFDSTRNRLVTFGGVFADNSRANDTWEFTGDTWSIRDSGPAGPSRPSIRDSAKMVFDSARGRCILFGGVSNGVLQNDTWAWNGSMWTQLAPSLPIPSPRRSQAMVYDSVRDRVVLFGGYNGSDNDGDTWEFDGTNWQLITLPPNTSPLPRRGAECAFDAARGRVVLFGGMFQNGARFNDTWEWDGVRWTQISSLAFPPPRIDHALTYQPWTGGCMLFAGSGTSGNLADSWTYHGSHRPAVLTQPVPQAVREGETATFSVSAAGIAEGGPLTYQWIVRSDTSCFPLWLSDDGHFSGTQTPTLTINNVVGSDARGGTPCHGYSCLILNTCFSDSSSAVGLTVYCRADINLSGGITVQDIFDFLRGYFSGNLVDADYNRSGFISVQDIFDFLRGYFMGC